MHSHDRTLIASLGFADKDKQNPDHEKACHFLVQPAISDKLCAVSRWKRDPRSWEQTIKINHVCEVEKELRDRDRGYRWSTVYTGTEKSAKRPISYVFSKSESEESLTEIPISKEQDKYRTTIGFIDVIVRAIDVYVLDDVGPIKCECSQCGWKLDTWPQSTEPTWRGDQWNVFVEVKITKIPLSDIIRQISLYRTYTGDRKDIWVIASPWGINEHEKQALSARSIYHVFLGEQFQEFSGIASPQAKSSFAF